MFLVLIEQVFFSFLNIFFSQCAFRSKIDLTEGLFL